MKRLTGIVFFLLLLAPALFAQEHYTEGPIWRVQLIRVKPTAMDAYLTSLRQSTKPLIEEQKRQGIIVDYKVWQPKGNPSATKFSAGSRPRNSLGRSALKSEKSSPPTCSRRSS